MLRQSVFAILLCTALGSAHAAVDGNGLGRIPVLGGVLQGLLPGGIAYVPVLGIPIPAISTEPLLGILTPVLNRLSQPTVHVAGPLLDGLVGPLLGLVNGHAARASALGRSAASLPPLGDTLPGLRPAP